MDAQWVGSIASAVAVIVAMSAIISTQRNLKRDRAERHHLRRYHAAVELLASFEQMERLRHPIGTFDEKLKIDMANQQLQVTRARFEAQLRACEEPLHFTRDVYASGKWDNVPVPDPDAPLVGQIYETVQTQAVRGEIVSAIDALRKHLNHD